jgi:hypothetical protein
VHVVICLALVIGAKPLALGFFDDSAAGLAAAGLAIGLLMLLGVMELILGPDHDRLINASHQ